MKYCSHCGNELFDEAVLCLKCGCTPTPTDAGAVEKKNRSHAPEVLPALASKKCIILDFLYAILSILSASFLIGSILDAWVSVYHNSDSSPHGYLRLNYDMGIAAAIFAFMALFCSITMLVLHTKRLDSVLKDTVKVAANVALFVLSLVVSSN